MIVKSDEPICWECRKLIVNYDPKLHRHSIDDTPGFRERADFCPDCWGEGQEPDYNEELARIVMEG